MDAKELAVTLVVGGVAGWIAGLIVRGGGFGLLGNVVVGVLGAVIGGFLFQALDIRVGTGLAATLVSAVAGAAVLLFVIRLIKK